MRSIPPYTPNPRQKRGYLEAGRNASSECSRAPTVPPLHAAVGARLLVLVLLADLLGIAAWVFISYFFLVI